MRRDLQSVYQDELQWEKPGRYRPGAEEVGAAVVVDRREHERRDVPLETHLFLRSEKPTIIPCRIVDLSPGGAQVQVNIRYRLPSQVFLLRNKGENICECEVVWQVTQAVGLKFVGLFAPERHQQLVKEIEAARLAMRV